MPFRLDAVDVAATASIRAGTGCEAARCIVLGLRQIYG